jgi:hypothetical protein
MAGRRVSVRFYNRLTDEDLLRVVNAVREFRVAS